MPDESAVPSLDTTSPGSVFISYSRDDLARVDPIVQLLSAAGLYLWWDREIAVGTPFRSAIQTILDEAACVVVFWSLTSVASQFVHSEASLGQEKGILVPVLLDDAARIPVGFTELQFLDLTQWDGTANQLSRLIHPIRRLVARGPAKNSYVSTLFKNDWGVGNSQRVVSELAGLTAQVRSLADILIVDSPAARDLRAVLHEVDKTYRVVSSAVLQFVTPALSAGPLDARPYLELERGGLRTRIENGRGHCGLILTYYGRYGGVRDSLVTKLDPTMLDQVDAAFSRLGTADGDLFVPLIDIGEILTNESRIIGSMILSGQHETARKRIIDGRIKLAPFEDQLSTAMKQLQQLASALGGTLPA